MDSPNFSKPPTYLAVVKTNSQYVSKTICGSQNWLSKLLQAFYMLGGRQNELPGLLQASYTLGGSQIGLSEPVHAFYTLCGIQNGLSKLL